MKTKTLLLGALPVPVEGCWVPIHDCVIWSCRVETFPSNGFNPSVTARLDVLLSDGQEIEIPLRDRVEITGSLVRVVLLEAIEKIRSISIFLEEVKRT